MYQTAGGRKKKRSKKGGSYLSEHMNKINIIYRKLKSKKIREYFLMLETDKYIF